MGNVGFWSAPTIAGAYEPVGTSQSLGADGEDPSDGEDDRTDGHERE